MKTLAIFGFVLLSLPSIAGCNDIDTSFDFHRLLTYPFTGTVAWSVHDVDIEERIIERFGQPVQRIPMDSEGSVKQIGDYDTTILEYDDMVFHLQGNVGYPNKIIQSIIVTNENAPIVFGIQLGKNISVVPFENPPDDIGVGRFPNKVAMDYTSYATIESGGIESVVIANCSLIIQHDEEGIISSLEWHYGTGH